MKKELKSISIKKVEGGSELTTVEFISSDENIEGYMHQKMREYNGSDIINNETQCPSFSTSGMSMMMSNYIDNYILKNESDLKNRCTHKYKGELSVKEQKDGSVVCNICDHKFNKIEDTDTVVSEINVIDMLESIKLFYLDMNKDDIDNIAYLLGRRKYSQVDYNYIKNMHNYAIVNFNKYKNK